MKASAACFVCVASLAACGPGNLDGSVQGHKIALQSAIFAPYTMIGYVIGESSTAEKVLGPAVDALFSDDPNACGNVNADTGVAFHPSHTYLFMHLNQQYYTQRGASGVPEVAAGYYSAQNPAAFDSGKQGGTALFYFKAPGCQADDARVDPSSYGLDGGILVNDINKDGALTGDIDVKLGEHGDALKGSVHVSHCPALATMLKKDLSYDPGAWTCE